jgi:hypothetical protein
VKALLALVAATAAAVSLCGCGTACNLAGGLKHPDEEPKVYGGVQRDLVIAGQLIDGSQVQSDESQGNAGVAFLACAAALCVADPVLSFVGDTLTLPVTVPLQNKRVRKDERKQAEAAGPPAGPKGESVPQVEALPVAEPGTGASAGSGGTP